MSSGGFSQPAVGRGVARPGWFLVVLALTFTLLVSLLLPAGFSSSTPAAAGLPVKDSGWDSAPVGTEQAMIQPCADLLFVGVRGSGETDPYGHLIVDAKDQLAKVVNSKASVRQVYIDYPAAAVSTLSIEQVEGLLLDNPMPQTSYMDSAKAGAELVRKVLNDSAARCPHETVALVAYSQGAQATTEAFAAGVDHPRIGAVVLLGNPHNSPGQAVRILDGLNNNTALGVTATWLVLRDQVNPAPGETRQSTVPRLLESVFDVYVGVVDPKDISTILKNHGALLPKEALQYTFSVCANGDIVCDAAGTMKKVLTGEITWQGSVTTAQPAHRSYHGDVITKTMQAAGDRVNSQLDLSSHDLVAKNAKDAKVYVKLIWLAVFLAIGVPVIFWIVVAIRHRGKKRSGTKH